MDSNTATSTSTGDHFVHLFGTSAVPSGKSIGDQLLDGFSQVIGKIIEERIAEAIGGRVIDQKIEEAVTRTVCDLDLPDNAKVVELVEEHSPSHECSYDDWCEHARSWDAVDRDDAWSIAHDVVTDNAICDLNDTDVDDRIKNELDDRLPSDVRTELEKLDTFMTALRKFMEDLDGGRSAEAETESD